MDVFGLAAQRAASHHGLVDRGWLIAAGVPAGQLQRWLSEGRLQKVHTGVYRLAGVPITWEQRVLAAVLGAGHGSAASHRSAGRLWSMCESDVLDVSVPPGRRRRLSGVSLHMSGDLVGSTLSLRRGIPVTNPLRTLVDLGAVLTPAELEDALDRALVARLVKVAGVEQALDQLARRGRPGIAAMRAMLDQRALGRQRPDSLLESRMARLLRRFDLPPAAFQYVISRNGRFVARVDFAYAHLRLAIEVDGYENHGTRRGRQSDYDRDSDLLALGWRVIRFTWEDVVLRPEKVAARLRAVVLELTCA